APYMCLKVVTFACSCSMRFICTTSVVFFFFFNDTATTEIYTLSLHDALPISTERTARNCSAPTSCTPTSRPSRSEEHTSELQSRENLVCRLLLEKKKTRDSSGENSQRSHYGINRAVRPSEA